MPRPDSREVGADCVRALELAAEPGEARPDAPRSSLRTRERELVLAGSVVAV